MFKVHIYGDFRSTWAGNAIMNATLDCSSHCEMYHAPPETWGGESFDIPFCGGGVDAIEQPLGRGKKATCPPSEPRFALLTSILWVVPLIVHVPVSHFASSLKRLTNQKHRCGTISPSMRRLPAATESTVSLRKSVFDGLQTKTIRTTYTRLGLGRIAPGPNEFSATLTAIARITD